MPNKHLGSESVVVFPSAKRANQSSDYKASRLAGESSFVNAITRVASRPSYVITEVFTFGAVFEFILGGYYFSILIDNLDEFKETKKVFAAITISTVDKDFPELEGNDEGGNYTGLTITDNPVPPQVYLQLLEYDGTDWKVPPSSLYRFNFNQIYFSDLDVIDCGTVGL